MSWADALFPRDGDRTVAWDVVDAESAEVGPGGRPEAVALYRPVGLAELRLIAADGWRAFPPRLPDQPIFYPVLERAYAEQIAREWNAARESTAAGFVTRFAVDGAYIRRYPIYVVGQAALHRELWVPAEELEAFNAALRSPIAVIDSFYGDAFAGEVDPQSGLPVGILAT